MRWAAAVGLSVACHAAAPPAVVVEPVPPPKPAVHAPTPSPFPEVSPFRLPHTFEPARYRLRIALGDARFSGHVEIEGELSDAVSLIWLHGVDLVVTRARAIGDSGEVELAFSAPRMDQMLGLRSEHELAPGKWALVIDYDAPIRELQPQVENREYGGKVDRWATGVFRRTAGGRSYVYTQGEAIYARQIVPCIDEPDRKVPWQLTLDVARDVIAASNAPIVREAPLDKDHKRVEFAETRPLPSYLLAFAVGPFDVIDAGRAKSGVPIRILVQQGHAGNAAWAAPETRRILDFLEDYFAIPYAYGKLDLVSVPHTGWGAMENPGLVTVGERWLEEAQSRETIAHELAHQWFGDLVTMAWWDDIWLNESFAQWMAAKIELHLDGGEDDRVELRERGLQRTGSRIRQPADTPAALKMHHFAPFERMLDGRHVLELLEAHLGPNGFRDAIRAYIKQHVDASVTTTDLEAAVNRVSKLSIPFDWILRTGVRSISTTLTCDARGARFEVGGMPWPTLVCVAYDREGKRAQTCATVDARVDAIPLPARSCPRWVMPIVDAAGLYSVSWSEPIVAGLTEHGWPFLSRDERVLLFEELSLPAAQLPVFVKMHDELTSERRARFLAEIDRYVPDDLRARYEELIRSELGVHAKELTLEPSRAPGASRVEAARIVLAASIHDARLTTEAVKLAARYRDLPLGYRYLTEVLALAATASPELRDQMLAYVAASRNDDPRGVRILHALAHVPSAIEAVAHDPARFAGLAAWIGWALFADSCSAAALANQEVIAAQLHLHRDVSRSVTECIATKATLDPAFRAWLAKP